MHGLPDTSVFLHKPLESFPLWWFLKFVIGLTNCGWQTECEVFPFFILKPAFVPLLCW